MIKRTTIQQFNPGVTILYVAMVTQWFCTDLFIIQTHDVKVKWRLWVEFVCLRLVSVWNIINTYKTEMSSLISVLNQTSEESKNCQSCERDALHVWSYETKITPEWPTDIQYTNSWNHVQFILNPKINWNKKKKHCFCIVTFSWQLNLPMFNTIWWYSYIRYTSAESAQTDCVALYL